MAGNPERSASAGGGVCEVRSLLYGDVAGLLGIGIAAVWLTHGLGATIGKAGKGRVQCDAALAAAAEQMDVIHLQICLWKFYKSLKTK